MRRSDRSPASRGSPTTGPRPRARPPARSASAGRRGRPRSAPGASGTRRHGQPTRARGRCCRRSARRRAGPGGCRRPSGGGDRTNSQAERVDAVRAERIGQQDDAARRRAAIQTQVQRAGARARRRRDGADELDRHRDAERDAVERLVEEKFIAPSDEAERDREAQVGRRRPRTAGRQASEQDGRGAEAQQRRAGRRRRRRRASPPSAAPNWTDTPPPSTSATGGTRSAPGLQAPVPGPKQP